MSSLRGFLALVFTILLTGCSSFAPGPSVVSRTMPVVAVTPVVSTAFSSTAAVETVEPVIITQPPPDYTPPPTPVPPTLTPIPPLPGGLGPTELKYLVLEQFPDLFFCDPDFYPVAVMDEQILARQRFPVIQANLEEFNAILAHNNLTGLSSFSDDQMLLIYREHKKLAAIQFLLASAGYQFQLQSAKTEGSGELITGLIDSQGVITVQQKLPTIATCPICLAAGTRIDTPTGPVLVESLRTGMQVWTVGGAGTRVSVPILRVSRTIAPASHRVLHLVLNDGRQVWVSPGHPTAAGSPVGHLRVGDALDGARVLSIERVAYTGYATYDLLPAGDTSFYWANGILIASTLAR